MRQGLNIAEDRLVRRKAWVGNPTTALMLFVGHESTIGACRHHHPRPALLL